MTTPILTKNQQRKSLSAKKGPIKGLKNVLAQPQENYWPTLKNENGHILENLLETLLPVIKRSGETIPWSQLRKMTKEERIAAKKEIKTKPNPNYNEKASKDIVFGVNSITRLLEKDSASCVLLDSSVEPSVLIKHVVIMAKDKNIPVLLISSLKKVTAKAMGFPSAAIALKKDVSEATDSYFHSLFQKVSEFSSEIPKPRGPLTLFENNTNEDNKLDESLEDIVEMEEDKEEVVKPVVVSTDVYLHRSSKKERVFKPSGSSEENRDVKKSWGDYIALGDCDLTIDKEKPQARFFELNGENNNKKKTKKNKKGEQKMEESEETKEQSKKIKKSKKEEQKMEESEETKEQSSIEEVSYKPLKVKRLQGNTNRTKATKVPKQKKK